MDEWRASLDVDFVEDPFGNRLALIEPASGLIESAGSHRAWWTITRTACTSPPD
jgi:hypothetical protein